MPPDAAPAGEPLQFDTVARPSNATPPKCAQCGAAIHDHYFEVNGAIVCERCRAGLESNMTGGSGSRAGRLGRATLYGFLAAVAGALLYYGVRAVTGYELGLIAIVVGFLVGRAVQMGSRGRGGWRYQTLAVGLTYLAIGSTYVPMFLDALKEAKPGVVADSSAKPASGAAVAPASTPANAAVPTSEPVALTASSDAATAASAGAPDSARAVGTSAGPSILLGVIALVALALAAPVLANLGAMPQGLIGLAIVAFALMQAWKMNRRVVLTFTGPYKVGDAPPAVANAPQPAA